MAASAAKAKKLVRKQFLVSDQHITKLSKLAKAEGKSEAEIVRLAIEAFDPNQKEDMSMAALMELASDRLKEAIKATKKTNALVNKTLRNLQTQS